MASRLTRFRVPLPERMRLWVALLLATEHLRLPVLLMVLASAVGTVGYMLLLDLSLLDGLYQSLTTLSTVGFREVVPFTAGAKLFTVFLIPIGVGTVLYTLTLLVATVVEGQLRTEYRRRVMLRRIQAMRGHHILCGFGRVGEEIAQGLDERRADFVVVDPDPDAVRRATGLGYEAIEGSGVDEAVLQQAGIARASSLLAAANSDAQNVYIALTAKKLASGIYVVARSEVPSSEPKLRLAGVDRVVSPHAISGRRMLLAALQPLITDFVDTLSTGRHGEQILAELVVAPDSALAGRTLAEAFASAPGTTILGVRRADGSLQVGPRGEARLTGGDVVIVLAPEEQIAKLHGARPGSRRVAP